MTITIESLNPYFVENSARLHGYHDNQVFLNTRYVGSMDRINKGNYEVTMKNPNGRYEKKFYVESETAKKIAKQEPGNWNEDNSTWVRRSPDGSDIMYIQHTQSGWVECNSKGLIKHCSMEDAGKILDVVA